MANHSDIKGASTCVCGQCLGQGKTENSTIGKNLGKKSLVPGQDFCGEPVCGMAVWMERFFQRTNEIEQEIIEEKLSGKDTGNTQKRQDKLVEAYSNRYSSLYQRLYNHKQKYHAEREERMELPDEFDNTIIFNNTYLDNIVKLSKCAFWSSKLAHFHENAKDKRKEEFKKQKGFFALRMQLIKELVKELPKKENQEHFTSWGFSKDDEGKCTLLVDIPGHGQITFHVQEEHIGRDIIDKHRYPGRYTGERNQNYPEHSSLIVPDGVDNIELKHNMLVVKKKDVKRIYPKNVLNLYYKKSPINQLYVVAKKDGRLIPFNRELPNDIDIDPRYLIAAGTIVEEVKTPGRTSKLKKFCAFNINKESLKNLENGEPFNLEEPFAEVNLSGGINQVYITRNTELAQDTKNRTAVIALGSVVETNDEGPMIQITKTEGEGKILKPEQMEFEVKDSKLKRALSMEEVMATMRPTKTRLISPGINTTQRGPDMRRQSSGGTQDKRRNGKAPDWKTPTASIQRGQGYSSRSF